MPELKPKERLQPSLLERLVAPRPEAGNASVVSLELLRESVRRELTALFSAVSLDVVDAGLGRSALAQRSSLNFGVSSALSGRTASSVALPQLERQLARAIRDFEPRLSAHSLRVRFVGETGSKSHNTLRFEIEGDLWAQPLAQKVLLRTELDLESGQVRIDEVRTRGRSDGSTVHRVL